ncbi:MAG TPA: hypothetical protein VIW29_13415 [Polyangiaceae bacterium]
MPRSLLHPWLVVGALVSLSACGGAGQKPPAAPSKSAAPAPAPKPPRERLLAALRAVDRAPPVLDVLPSSARSSLDARLASLTPEQREQLLGGDLAESMPLLHLKAGGSSGAALFVLATTPAPSVELPFAFELMGKVSDEDRLRLVKLAHDLAQRAALHFLRDRVLDLANASAAELPNLLGAIERVALAAERPDIARLALEAWVAAGAPSEVLYRLGAACAYDEDEKCVDEALEAVPETSPEHARLEGLRKALASRRDGDPIVRAWSLLRLGRYADAQKALSPVEAKSKSDLRVAAARAVVVADGSACPGLQPGVGSPELCADAVLARPGLSAALAELEVAWQSGGGRDAASIEAYVGLAHVVPWVTELSLATDAASLERNFNQRYRALAKVLAELPNEKPLAVFASALDAGVSAGLHMGPGERPRIDSNRRQELYFAALSVEAAAPRLAVGALLAPDQQVLQLLPKGAPLGLAPAWAGLMSWEAAGNPDPAVLEAARSALAERLTLAPRGTTDSAATVLLLAELDAAAAPSERTHAALAQIAGQLIGQPLPPELALRAVLDAAGALERMGRTADALGVLSKAAEIASLPGPAGELLTLIRAEQLVLSWDAKRDPERKALSKALAALPRGSAPPTLVFALGAWGSAKALRQGKLPPKALLEERIGQRAAESMARGTLRGTSVSLRVSYTFRSGVVPEVTFEPMFVPLVRPDLLAKAIQ